MQMVKHDLERELYERQASTNKKTSNYHEHLPAAQSELANEILKDPFNLIF
jgi:predicted nuclease of restriction endonuclease-like (RecB) superfamily